MEREIQDMQALGYRVEGHMMFVPRQTSAVRAVKRYLSKGKDGKDQIDPDTGKVKRGRLVPVHVILQNTENERHFDYMKKHFDKWSAYDNQGKEPVFLSRGSKEN